MLFSLCVLPVETQFNTSQQNENLLLFMTVMTDAEHFFLIINKLIKFKFNEIFVKQNRNIMLTSTKAKEAKLQKRTKHIHMWYAKAWEPLAGSLKMLIILTK